MGPHAEGCSFEPRLGELVVTGMLSPPSAADVRAALAAHTGDGPVHVVAGVASVVRPAVVSVHQPLVDRAEEFVRMIEADLASVREQGFGTGELKPSVEAFAELAMLVRDLARAVAG